MCAEEWSRSIRLQYVLYTTWREVAPADVTAALPSPDQLESWCIVSRKAGYHRRLRQGLGNVLLLAAQVCEKLDRPADALMYMEKALRFDPDDPTTDMRPTTQAQGHTLRVGRVLAAQGNKAEASAPFEQAIDVSHRTGLRLYELFALRDLKQCVLDADGRSDEGLTRRKAVLREMKGPPAELTKLLGGRLDADAIGERP